MLVCQPHKFCNLVRMLAVYTYVFTIHLLEIGQ